MKGKIQPIQQSMAKKLLFFGGIALLTIFSQAIFRENSFAVTIENEGDTTLILKYISSECTTKTAKTVTIKSQGYEQFS
ncbi:hypothetical protein D6219_04820 [Coxiella burnetii]|uniref:hypothetical protein n=1 Tax=Coxiella burnetii TaxID=777 RepID=UPI0002E151EE|nr:hypothetical protein [Coxiella burnetii]AZV75198.1 hypothetical protein D6219_04820 [Coxiella burnetii]RQM79466.1 hypothetical protein EHS20_06655 [Coxiella burnetii]